MISDDRYEKTVRFCIFNIAVPLIIGLTVYLLFRTDAHIARWIYRLLAVDPPEIGWHSLWLERIVRNYVADIAWAYAFMSVMILILGETNKERITAFCITCALIILSEVFQKTGLISGTFDYMDISIEILAAVAALSISKKFGGRNEKTD